MADSFFGFDTSLSNLNDDEGGGEPSEDEYDALNDETFGQDSEEFDWEVEHEHLAEQLESSRRSNTTYDDVDTRLEASLCKLVLDETDAPQSRVIGSSVWRHDGIGLAPTAPTPIPPLKNVCTVEELERQLRQNQSQNQNQNQSQNQNQMQANFAMPYFQPRFPPVILQRPPGLQAPVPLPFAPQQPMAHSMNQLNQPLNKIIGQNAHNQMTQPNQMMNHMPVNQLGQNVNQMPQNMNQMGQNVNQFMQNANQMNQFQNNQMGQGLMASNMNVHQMGQNNQLIPNSMNPNLGQMGQNMNQNMNTNMGQPNMSQMNQMGQNLNQIGPNMNPHQMGQNMNQINQNIGQMGQNMNQMSQNMAQMGQNMNQLTQNVTQMSQMNQMSQNVNQIMPNGNQFGQMNQFPHMMGQPRMMAPPPGISMPRQNFSPNMNQFNPNFRGPSMPTKPNEQPINQQPLNQQPMNQQPLNQQPPINQLNQTPLNQTPVNQQPLNQSMIMGQMKNQPANQLKPVQTTPNKVIQKPTQTQIQSLQNQKVQKTRIYNNKNLTPPTSVNSQPLSSQSLVQIIQNTHPMLQFNNSFHNASHHPMLNRNNLFNQFNIAMFANRPNGTFINATRHSNGDDSSLCSDSDEYAGLMTPREKQWLINIQMLQLNTGTPYVHDFYYTVFLERQASKEKEGIKEAHKANQQNHPFYSAVSKQDSARERRNSHRHNSTSEEPPRTYVPTQFENSLGKLQCGSVTAPRKIIDVEVVAGEPPSGRASRAPSVASTTNPAEVPRELKRTKQLLLDIEALYLILLRLEELNDPLAISNALILKEREEKQRQQEAAQKEALENDQEEDSNLFLRNIESVQRRKQESPKSECIDKRQVVNLAVSQKPPPVKNLLDEDKDDLLNKMFLGLLHSDRLQQMLTVRKGRALIARFLSRAPASHCRLRALWCRVLRALPAAARRGDAGLAPLAPHYRRYIQNTTGWSAVMESCGLLSEALDPARTPHVLTSCLSLSCVCALFERALILVNTPDATSNERQWYKFLKTLARALKNTTLTVARPVEPLSEEKLLFHLKQLESRSTIEILQRGKAAEFVDLTKSDVSGLLVKHLC